MKATILIVEDEDFIRAMLQLAFARHGFAVLTAGNVADGLALAATHSIDAILTDFQLPGDNGLDLCRVVQKQNEALARQLPVWMMTGSRDLSDAMAADAGAREVFRKPFKAADVCEKIERFLHREAGNREFAALRGAT